MRLTSNLHLGYCTNIHRGEDWAQTFESLQQFTLAVRRRVCPKQPYGFGLRLSDQAARELSEPKTLLEFQRWLDRENCYVFTINGFPYGKFHGTRVKEQVYAPDWTQPERLAYTNRLFELLAQLLPTGLEGSVSTVPGSFREFIKSPDQENAMRQNLWKCVEHLAALNERTGKFMHLGLEPEPLCYLETTDEAIRFFEQMQGDRPGDERLRRFLGITYDTCHLAVEFEDAEEALERLRKNRIRISKIHLSSALRVNPAAEARKQLATFAESTYLHQVIERCGGGELRRFKDLDQALNESCDSTEDMEWRIHFHVPLHSPPTRLFGNTSEQVEAVLKYLQAHPQLCSHLEMETYTWEVMPEELKNRSVVEQLVSEYNWTLQRLANYGFKPL